MTASDLLDLASSTDQSLTALDDQSIVAGDGLLTPLRQACRSWLLKSPSQDTRSNYERDLGQFLTFCGFAAERR